MNELLKLSKTLEDAGYRDLLLIEPEDARKILTEKRLEIIRKLQREDVESIRGLARELGRGENVVHRDLKTLFEEGVIDFEEEGKRKVPVLRHENIWIKPLTAKKTPA